MTYTYWCTSPTVKAISTCLEDGSWTIVQNLCEPDTASTTTSTTVSSTTTAVSTTTFVSTTTVAPILGLYLIYFTQLSLCRNTDISNDLHISKIWFIHFFIFISTPVVSNN